MEFLCTCDRAQSRRECCRLDAASEAKAATGWPPLQHLHADASTARSCLVGWPVGIKCRGSICIHAASKAFTADAGEHGRLLLPGWLVDQVDQLGQLGQLDQLGEHHLQHLPPSVLCPMPAQPANAHFEKGPTLSSPQKSIRQTQQQSSVEIIIIPMLKSYWSDDDEGSKRGFRCRQCPRIPRDDPTFVFPKIKRAFLVHVLIGTFWPAYNYIPAFLFRFFPEQADSAYKRAGK